MSWCIIQLLFHHQFWYHWFGWIDSLSNLPIFHQQHCFKLTIKPISKKKITWNIDEYESNTLIKWTFSCLITHWKAGKFSQYLHMWPNHCCLQFVCKAKKKKKLNRTRLKSFVRIYKKKTCVYIMIHIVMRHNFLSYTQISWFSCHSLSILSQVRL